MPLDETLKTRKGSGRMRIWVRRSVGRADIKGWKMERVCEVGHTIDTSRGVMLMLRKVCGEAEVGGRLVREGEDEDEDEGDGEVVGGL